jgi:long-chain acyl-CoA synthetase
VILYTSGTTSDPKGVMLSHGNLIAERHTAFAVVNVGETDSVLGILPLFHSLAQLANLLLPFAVGARVVYLETVSSQELVRALSEREITIFACVPQFFYLIHERIMREVEKRGAVARLAFRLMLETSFRARRVGLNLGPTLFGKVHALMGRQMRLFVTGGSKFDPAIGRDLYALGFTILQAYGLTETSGACTINAPHEAHLDTVGRPLPGTEIKILPPERPAPSAVDTDDEPVDGEIAIRGPLIMQGYFGRPDATAAVMQDGWFLSGDLGRIDAEGRVTITGRKKEVIILANGKNLYPEEIEAHYRASPFVKEMAVTTLAADDKPAGERLYAVVVPNMELLREPKIVNAGDILRFEFEGLGARLPSYKRVLGYEISFEPLPRTTTGKLKRHEIVKRLAQTAHAAKAEASAADQAWRDDPHVAAALALVQRRATGDSPLTPSANLELDLGLDSMERVELIAELEQTFGTTNCRRRHRTPSSRSASWWTRCVQPPTPPVRRGADRQWGHRRPGRDPRGRHLVGHAAEGAAAADRSGARRPAVVAPVRRAAALPAVAGVTNGHGPGRGARAREAPGGRRLSHLPQPPELRGRVLPLRGAAVSYARAPVLRRRGRVLRDAADGAGRADHQLCAGRSRLESGAGDEGRRVWPGARQGADAVP